ncbi:MAG: glutamine--tRNA ligase/YqeY domain fusion protein [Magnetococcales bacterium]|nr:glutamine--tRNA ligase/YqeY domain fusion protein [Magnetococcales bacterium]
MSNNSEHKAADFIRAIVAEDRASGKHPHPVTRFPPEPNGYLHIGHAKSICLNFGIAEENPGGVCHLRFDDTNPAKEEQEYIDAIQRDVRWLGFDWGDKRFFASDYFEQLYQFAETLIKKGKAYVCSLSAEEVRDYRGTLTRPGRESPFRNRTVEENLDLFRRMRAGEFPDGTHTLRAKIDMASPNLNMRDPTLYRILRTRHHQTGDAWSIYPLYDFTHCLSDALEGITHSLCTLEFEDHRPLYDWVLDLSDPPCHPRQIEFSRLSLEYTVVSKRKLIQLVESGAVTGWDDPRMPTISGLRRRGYTPRGIRDFCRRVGITKAPNNVELALLENCVREDLEQAADRAMAVLDPLKVVIETWPEDQVEELTAPVHPALPERGVRTLPFTREIYIERDDFRLEAPKKFKRLTAGGEVRLRNAYVIRCKEVIRDERGEVVELRCSHDAMTLNAQPEGRKVSGVIHWVSATRHARAEVRLYDKLFTRPDPDDDPEGGSFMNCLNPQSLVVLQDRPVEEGLAAATAERHYQFERVGYFIADHGDSTPGRLVFNRTVTLRDSWAKLQAREQEGEGR